MGNAQVSEYFIAGWHRWGVVSRTVIAPIERVKTAPNGLGESAGEGKR